MVHRGWQEQNSFQGMNRWAKISFFLYLVKDYGEVESGRKERGKKSDVCTYIYIER